MKTSNTQLRAPRVHRAWLMAAVAALAVLLVPSWGLIASGFVNGRGAFDQLNYHEQVVRTFAAQLPTPDYRDYLSATTPGYHTLLAVVARLVSDERWVLQLAGSLFTVGLIVVLAWGVDRSGAWWHGSPRWHGSPSREEQLLAGASGSDGDTLARARGSNIVLLLPVVASMSVFYAATWMLPDNAGWLGVLVVWLLALRPRFDAVTLVGGGLALAALVFVRQIHLWPLALLLTAAWLGTPRDADTPFDFAADLRELLADVPTKLGRVGLALLAGVPAIAVLVYFWSLWGNTLTPPVFKDRHVGGNLTAPAFVLTVFGACSVFFLPYMLDGLRRLWVQHTWLLALAAGVGLAIALIAPTTRDYAHGRYSGLWEIVRHLPAPMGRSVLIVPLTVLGSVLLAAWFVTLGRRDRWIMLAAMVAFIAAQCASFKLWQRYTEPMVLLWLALAAARVPPPRSGAGQGWRLVGPVTLALLMAAITTASLLTARPVLQRTLIAPWETQAPLLPGMVERAPEFLAPGFPAPGFPEMRDGPDRPDEPLPDNR